MMPQEKGPEKKLGKIVIMLKIRPDILVGRERKKEKQ